MAGTKEKDRYDAGFTIGGTTIGNAPARPLNGLDKVFVQDNSEATANEQVRVANYGHLLGSRLCGGKIVWLGTSIPASASLRNYAVQSAAYLGATLVNTSIAGQTICYREYNNTLGGTCMTVAEWEALTNHPTLTTHSYEQIFTETNADADLWVFDVCSNCYADAGLDRATSEATTAYDNFDFDTFTYDSGDFDTEAHRRTYMGALLFLLNELWTLNPQAKVVFVVFKGNAQLGGNLIRTQTKLIAEKCGIPVIDVDAKFQFNPVFAGVEYYPEGDRTDYVHPNDAGHDRIAEIIIPEMLRL